MWNLRAKSRGASTVLQARRARSVSRARGVADAFAQAAGHRWPQDVKELWEYDWALRGSRGGAFKILYDVHGGPARPANGPWRSGLVPGGRLHKVFSPPDVIAATQNGCRAASIRCETCKIEASRSVCRVTEPIHAKRAMLESKIDETWARLRSDSLNKAAKRAEETMVSVRGDADRRLSHGASSP